MIHGKRFNLSLCKFVCQCVESLQSACKLMCNEFSIVFSDKLRCQKDFELDIKFKLDITPVFCKLRPDPFAIHEELAQVY